MAPVEPDHVTPTQSLHQPAERGRFVRRQQQVNVIRHQDVGMHGHLMCRRKVAQQSEKALAVGGVAKDLLPVVAALDDVVGVAG
jgi:hypothetical protein